MVAAVNDGIAEADTWVSSRSKIEKSKATEGESSCESPGAPRPTTAWGLLRHQNDVGPYIHWSRTVRRSYLRQIRFLQGSAAKKKEERKKEKERWPVIGPFHSAPIMPLFIEAPLSKIAC